MLRATSILAIGIVAGRVAGLLREIVLASQLGATEQADVAILVLTLPDALTAFLLSGAVSAVLVPEFTRHIAQQGARAALRDAEIVVVAIGLVLAAVVTLAAGPIVAVIGPGLSDGSRATAAQLLALSSLALPLAGLSAVAVAYLQSHRRFIAAAAGTLVVNAVLIVFLIVAVRPAALTPVAIGVVAAGAARWALQRVDAARVADRAGTSTLRRDLARFGGRYGAAIAGTSALVLLPFAMRALASLGGSGEIATVNYALRILELPLGAFITVGSIAALPFLAELISRGDEPAAATLFRQLVLVTQIVTVPLALGGILASAPIALLLYGRPAVGDAVIDIGTFAAIGMVSLPAQGIASIAQAYLIARGRLVDLRAINGSALLLYVLVGGWLVNTYGTRGVMLGYVALHCAVAVALLIGAARAAAPLTRAVVRDMAAAFGLSVGVFLLFAAVDVLLATNAAVTFAIAAVGAVAALGVALLPRYPSLGTGGVLRLLFARQ